jgi:hypothetical protein
LEFYTGLTTLLSEITIVAKSKAVKSMPNLAKFYKEGNCSESIVLPMMLNVMNNV